MPPVLLDLLGRSKQAKTKPFSPTLMEFSVHFSFQVSFSRRRRMNQLVRKAFNNCLPCPKILDNYTLHANYQPGINKQMIKTLRAKVQGLLEGIKYVFTTVTFDEMYIKTLGAKSWNRNACKWDGVMDTCRCLYDFDKDGLLKDAKKVLAFVLSCINGYSYAYFLIDSLDGNQKLDLVNQVLPALHQENDWSS